jgi:8-oxo-dGTP pyrophosphatase MutT (NUDIX family)
MKDARLIETEILLPKPKRFVHEALEMPDGHRIDWYYVDCAPSVLVVPCTADGQLVMVRQYRHNLRDYQLEFPAGIINEGEAVEEAALRELDEETGYRPGPSVSLKSFGAYYSLPSETNKYTHVFLAEPVVPNGPPCGDTEIEKYFDMSVELISVKKARAEIGRAITGMEAIAALMMTGPGYVSRQWGEEP